jgi:hypothetical protein
MYLFLCLSLCEIANDMNISDVFNVVIGLKQGESLSHLLSILFINDINQNTNFDVLTESDFELLSMYTILFASGDIVYD